jgi:hypothetical protein
MEELHFRMTKFFEGYNGFLLIAIVAIEDQFLIRLKVNIE